MNQHNSARKVKKAIYAWYLLFTNKKTPILAKALALYVVIRLAIPLHFLPDIIVVPLLILLIVKITPKKLVDESYLQAEEMLAAGKKINFLPLIIFVAIWLIGISIILLFLYRNFF